MESFSIRWKKSNNIPLYEQLYLHIKNEIITGRLAYCSQLPSKRKLQQNLNISQTTVENAYEQLIAEGFIESRPRSGYFVSANQEFLHHPPPSDIVTKTKKKQVKTKIAFDFSPGLINNSMFPFSSWRKLYKEALTFDNRDLLLLGPTTGEVELKEEIKKYLYQSRGVNCNIEQIIIGAGVEQLLPQLVLLLGNKKIYAIENPGYPLTNHVLTLHKRQFRLIDVDLEGAKVNDLKESGAN
jgi:GntR family transcriptional regulator/MocR family aminotransferase